MTEQILFENGKVSLTESQLIVEQQTFELASIQSIKIQTSPPNRRLSGNTAIVGALCLALDELFFIFGLLLLGVSAWLWKKTKPQHAIILTTSAGEKRVLVSDDETYIRLVFSALNDALINRQS